MASGAADLWQQSQRGGKINILKGNIICAQQILHYVHKQREIQRIVCVFLNFVIIIRERYSDCSPRASKNLGTPLRAGVHVKDKHVNI